MIVWILKAYRLFVKNAVYLQLRLATPCEIDIIIFPSYNRVNNNPYDQNANGINIQIPRGKGIA